MRRSRVLVLSVVAALIPGVLAVVIPAATANAAVACTAPAWNATTVYTGGQVVTHNNSQFTAKWWTQGETPSTTNQWGPWRHDGPCDGGTTPPPPPPPPPPPGNPPPSGAMAAAPYVYPGWGNPPAPATVMNATGVKWFTMAFILSAGGCQPGWDGGPLTGGAHASTISAIRAAGGDIIPSIGGWSGNKLGPNCGSAQALAGAYQKVIDTFNLKAIDVDIENSDEFESEVVQDRVLGTLKIIKQNNAGIKTILTFGTSTSGPTYWGTRLINRAAALQANVDVFTIMPFDFGGGANMFTSTTNATEGLKNALKTAFSWSDATAYAHMGISGMNGLSDQMELTTPETWTQIRDWAKGKGLARFAFWSVNRDRPCPGGGVTSNCSGIAQQDWQFTKITAGF